MNSLPKDRSLAYHLLFPLLRLPNTSLGAPENHVNTYLSTDNTLVLELTDRTSIQPRAFTHPGLVADYRAEGSQWMVYQCPEFTSELALFREGKYSQFLPEAKSLFRKQWSENYGSITNPQHLKESLLYWALSSDTSTATNYWVGLLDINPKILPQDLYYLPTEAEYIAL